MDMTYCWKIWTSNTPQGCCWLQVSSSPILTHPFPQRATNLHLQSPRYQPKSHSKQSINPNNYSPLNHRQKASTSQIPSLTQSIKRFKWIKIIPISTNAKMWMKNRTRSLRIRLCPRHIRFTPFNKRSS